MNRPKAQSPLWRAAALLALALGLGLGLMDVGLADDEGPAAATAAGSEADARASTRAARDERLCCPRRDSFGYSQTSPRRVHWLRTTQPRQHIHTATSI